MIRAERMAALAATEVTYGADPTPAAAVLLREIEIGDVEGDLVEVDTVRSGLGGRAKALHGRHVSIKGKIFLGGSGAAGTAPAWDWLARCTAHAAVVTAGSKVEYTPVDLGHESAAMYFNLEGNRTRILGMRGNLTCRWTVGQFPEAEFDLLGLFDANAAAPFPAVDTSAWKIPPLFAKDTVPICQIGGIAEVLQSIELKNGTAREYSELISRREIDITDRRPSIDATILEPDYSARIYQDSIGKPGLYKTLALTHGTVAGNIVKLDAAQWQMQTFSRTRISDKAAIKLGGEILPGAGIPDYKLTVQ